MLFIKSRTIGVSRLLLLISSSRKYSFFSLANFDRFMAFGTGFVPLSSVVGSSRLPIRLSAIFYKSIRKLNLLSELFDPTSARDVQYDNKVTYRACGEVIEVLDSSIYFSCEGCIAADRDNNSSVFNCLSLATIFHFGLIGIDCKIFSSSCFKTLIRCEQGKPTSSNL